MTDFSIGGTDTGSYASSRRGDIEYSEFENIRAWCAVGVPVQDMAKMLGRPVSTVERVASCFPRAAKREAYAPPKPMTVFLEGWEGPNSMFRRISAEVAEKHGISVHDLRGSDRRRTVAHARQEAFWRLRNETNLTLPQIGHWFGGRDHTTVLHGVRAHEARGYAQAPSTAEPPYSTAFPA